MRRTIAVATLIAAALLLVSGCNEDPPNQTPTPSATSYPGG